MPEITETEPAKVFYFSPSTRGFYIEGMHHTIPQDAAQCTEAEYQAALQAQSEGKVITVVSGQVVVQDPPAPSTDVLWARVRLKRNALLVASDKTMLPDYPGNPGKLQARTSFRAALRDLPQSQSDPSIISWPESPE